jgi:hypothetical protein
LQIAYLRFFHPLTTWRIIGHIQRIENLLHFTIQDNQAKSVISDQNNDSPIQHPADRDQKRRMLCLKKPVRGIGKWDHVKGF